jgi:hypothetical protein
MARARAAANVAMRVLGPVARMVGRGARALGTGLWRHREIVNAILVRALWWGALVAWWSAAVPLVAGGAIDVQRALVVFAAGTAVCAMVVALGRASRLRWWGGALGSVHGMCAVALWLVVNG